MANRERDFRAWADCNGHSDPFMIYASEPLNERHLNLYTMKVAYMDDKWTVEDGDAVDRQVWNMCENTVVSELTPLKDMNGRKIWEGDLLRYPAANEWEAGNFTAFEVFFHDNDANSDYNIGYSINRTHNFGAIGGGFIPSFKPKTVAKMVIIGNIYENPELLSSR